ncbi:hypothetical protein [Comamonas sp.]|uniref:hypothetical protein n=1 Tax=Comamonas sp. TaxID=34028 RepID=UPI0028983AAC|nr:hypothetical protein [Comamonas sp.]
MAGASKFKVWEFLKNSGEILANLVDAKMLLECEGKPLIHHPTPTQVRRVLSSLRSYGPSSYASLTDENKNYVQVAGGGTTCLMELYDAESGKRWRAFGDIRSKIFPDGTLLVFSAGQMPMMADEWISIDKVIEAFCCVLNGLDYASDIKWRIAPLF